MLHPHGRESTAPPGTPEGLLRLVLDSEQELRPETPLDSRRLALQAHFRRFFSCWASPALLPFEGVNQIPMFWNQNNSRPRSPQRAHQAHARHPKLHTRWGGKGRGCTFRARCSLSRVAIDDYMCMWCIRVHTPCPPCVHVHTPPRAHVCTSARGRVQPLFMRVRALLRPSQYSRGAERRANREGRVERARERGRANEKRTLVITRFHNNDRRRSQR